MPAKPSKMKLPKELKRADSPGNWVIEAEGGYKVDLKLKKRSKSAYYKFGAPQFHYSVRVPIDFQDLKDNRVELLESTFMRGKTVFIARIPLSERDRKDLMKDYPKKCRKCGYRRFQILNLTRTSIGSEASFECPYCANKIKLNWSDKW